MQRLAVILFTYSVFVMACQKTTNSTSIDNGTTDPNDTLSNYTPDTTIFPGTDTILRAGDSVTYEILTDEPRGWFGVWNVPEGISGTPLDSVSYGSPVYNFNGWRYSFVCPDKPFQALISAATFVYDHNITANLYKNGNRIKSVTNDAMKGVSKLMMTAETDSLTVTPGKPVLTYEVLITDANNTKFEYDAWKGQWNKPDGTVCDITTPLASYFALPSGWRYTFTPDKLPFTMYVGATPYLSGQAIVHINYYVNRQLMKSISSDSFIYSNTYIVN